MSIKAPYLNSPFPPLATLTINFNKIQFIHSNPGARLQIVVFFQNLEKKIPLTYKPLKETFIGDVITFPFEGSRIKNEGEFMRIELFFIITNKGTVNNKLVGVFRINMNEVILSNGDFKNEVLSFSDEITEKIYQPKIYLRLSLEKSFNPPIENARSPTFKFQNESNFNELQLQQEQSPSPSPKPEKNMKPKLTRSITPTPSSFNVKKTTVSSLAVGFVAMLKRNTSQSPIKRPQSFLSKSALITRNEEKPDESYEVFENKSEILGGQGQSSNEEIHEKPKKALQQKEMSYEIENYTTENEKLAKENEKIIEKLKKMHAEVFDSMESKPYNSESLKKALENKKEEGLELPEMLLLLNANENLAKQIEEKNESFLKLKKSLGEYFFLVTEKQKKIEENSHQVSQLRSELNELKFQQIANRKEMGNEEFDEYLKEYDEKIKEEREKNLKLEEIFLANQEENERLNETLCYEKELLKDQIREFSEERDLMRKALLEKDERMLDLERNMKLMNTLIVKIKEEKANIMNTLFETPEGGDIIVQINENSNK